MAKEDDLFCDHEEINTNLNDWKKDGMIRDYAAILDTGSVPPAIALLVRKIIVLLFK